MLDIENNWQHAVLFLLALVGAIVVLKNVGEWWDKKG